MYETKEEEDHVEWTFDPYTLRYRPVIKWDVQRNVQREEPEQGARRINLEDEDVVE